MAVPYDYYRIFYHVAQQHSFTRAAAVLGNNQPNVTRCMNNLEQELGCALFVRSNRGVSLTPEGEKLFAHVRLAYDQLTAGEEELRKDCRLENGGIPCPVSQHSAANYQRYVAPGHSNSGAASNRLRRNYNPLPKRAIPANYAPVLLPGGTGGGQ